MGIMSFLLPDDISAESRRELERSAIAGGPDNMPTPTELSFPGGQMRTRRLMDESGYLVAPWPVDGVGHVMGTTATLMERARPYTLLIELARGKINQMRNQAADWRMGGLQVSSDLQQAVHSATLAFGQAVTGASGGKPSAQETRLAQSALDLGYQASRQLVEAYIEQVFAIRHQRAPRLDTTLGCRVWPAAGTVPEPLASGAVPFAQSFNSISLPFSWCDIEPEEGNYQWDAYDELLAWAQTQQLQVNAGPLVDFSSMMLPAWLWMWERELPTMASFMCKFVEATVRRYRGRIRRWQVSAGSNCAGILGLGEEELLGLTYRLADAARQVDPSLELVIGIAQPWGEYMAAQEWTHSPFIFADTLIRSGINNLAALDLELIMGVAPRGSYCRDILETSRLLDLYALLGVPLRVTLGYPAATTTDPGADPELRIDAGRWREGFTPRTQAEWAAAQGGLTLCKPFVQAVQWVHLSDNQPHQFPHCGLVAADNQIQPALDPLRRLREEHLR
jgi:Glycosyl hydrolase family 10